MNQFNAWSDGIKVPHPAESPGNFTLFQDWCAKRKWCESQGWKMGEDFFLPGCMVSAKWYFKKESYQTLFVLKWG